MPSNKKPQRARISENQPLIERSSHMERLISPPTPQRIEEPEPEPELEKEKLQKMSIYVTDFQKAKLDYLAKEHRKKTGKSTTRIDVVRMLIEKATMDTLDD